ncbi:hypothetical protein [Mycobacterium marinum]|uniref:hypothetical protein n=1 Tax=Mycobacterium marinum TaxID=1781 RepID=UPI00041295E3|nr:hypothetical protein [Mycobacterium marinum]WCS18797.1 hypothetical protein MML61_02425 [Mycobacterium marinum]WOR05105.1 hypothetical protein QDR78_02325 [Mycobacterium marinum]BBC63598.1 integral membrane protein [Mycobacterium marinum]CDM74613.1 conserved integral membrane protein [Mycobacterium marinum E11]
MVETSRPEGRIDGPSKRVLWLVITQSGFYRTALQLGNVPIVLPFVVAELHAELWMAALIFPAFTAGAAIGNMLAPAVLAAVPRRRRLVIIVFGLTVLAAVNAMGATMGDGNEAGSLFLVNVLFIGAVSAFSFVAFADLVAAMPSGTDRAQVLLTEAGVGAALTAIVTVALSFVPHEDHLTNNIRLLWTATAAMAISGLICLGLPQRIVPPVHKAPGLNKVVHVGLAALRRESWYRRYLAVQLLFGSVVLGSSFYSIRVAAIPGDEHDNVVVLVLFVCVGLVGGIRVWNRIRERFGLFGLFAGSAILSIAAAVIAIAFQLAGSWPNLVAISLVIALASIANQSVFTAGQLWIAHNADPTLRISLIAFGRLVISAGLVGLSSLLGILAQFHDVVWPVMIVLLLNVAAAYSAKRLAPAD